MAAQPEPAPDWVDRVVFGDCRVVLRRMLETGFRVDSCVCSPPYWGLRTYGHDDQLGLEPSLETYIAAQADIFDMVRDLLTPHPPGKGESPKPAGTLWLNVGDAYVSQRKGSDGKGSEIERGKRAAAHDQSFFVRYARRTWLRRKNLIGLPWHLAFALQRRGWILRDCIIWEKNNPVPESARDRTTKCHEYLFMLTPGPVYYYDAQAIAELRVTGTDKPVGGWAHGEGSHDTVEHNRPGSGTNTKYDYGGSTARKPASGERRRPRSVWKIPTEPYHGPHYAAFPKALVARCILAGTPPGGIVMDPYMGTGTVAAVAKQLGRRYAGIELNEKEYAPLIAERLEEVAQGLEL